MFAYIVLKILSQLSIIRWELKSFKVTFLPWLLEVLILHHQIPNFNNPKTEAFWKQLKKDKMLVTSISPFLTMFSALNEANFNYFVICLCSQFGKIWKFAMWERVICWWENDALFNAVRFLPPLSKTTITNTEIKEKHHNHKLKDLGQRHCAEYSGSLFTTHSSTALLVEFYM